MANHLFIGLGGTGGAILRSLRKRVYEEFGSNDPSGKVFLEYIYVDSNEKDLNDRTSWKTIGASVHLDDVQKVNIHGLDAGVLDNLNQYSGIKSFITSEDRRLCDDLGSLITDGIGGQRRRLGRMLFANNICGPQNQSFNARLKDRVQSLQNRNRDSQVTFHICAGLAGGTGSGSIIDTIAQIRKEYKPQVGVGDLYKIELYLYVPEMVIVNPACEAGFYQSNGYASLLELNALSVGAYKPTDVSGRQLDEYGNVKRLLEGCDPFETAYLFSNINERGKQLAISSDLPASVADFLFQKCVASEQLGTGKLARLAVCENTGTTPERDAAGHPAHSRRFMSFGIKRIEFPENEIREYVAYNFVKQSINQFHYNKWADGIGYELVTEQEVGLGFQNEIRDKKTLEKLLLSENVLTLSKPIDSSDKSTAKWKEIPTAWEEWTKFFYETTMAEEAKEQWLPILQRKVRQQFDTGYRGLGVKDFYNTHRKDINGYAAFIRRHIERSLFAEWETGQRSILEVQKYVTVLRQSCSERIEKIKETISKYDTLIEGDLRNNLRKYQDEWNSIGWLKDAITHASSKVFDKYRDAVCELQIYRTKEEGLRFACELLAAINEHLQLLKAEVDLFASELTGMTEMVKQKIDAKCQLNEETLDAKIVKKYNPQQVRDITRRFVTDKVKQEENASEIRAGLVALLGDGEHSFSLLNGCIGDLDTLEDIMLKVSLKNGVSVMEDVAKDDLTQRMTHVNVMEKIKMEYNTAEKLEAFARELYNSAQCFLQFDNSEMSGDKAGEGMMKMIQLCLPKYEDPTNFRLKFIEAFKNVCSDYQFTDDDVCDNYKDNQIVVVSAASGFPLRFVANVANLKAKYDEKVNGDKSAFNLMVLHTESFKKPLPSLFNKNAVEMKKDIRPYIIKAFAMGLTAERQDPDTGEKYLALSVPDEDGFITYVKMGKTIVDALIEMSGNAKGVDQLMNLVDKKIKSDYVHNDRKAELKKSIVDLLNNQVLALFNNNDQNSEYQLFMRDARAVIKNELKEQ